MLQRVKDLALSLQRLRLQLCCGFDPWPRNFHMPWVWTKRAGGTAEDRHRPRIKRRAWWLWVWSRFDLLYKVGVQILTLTYKLAPQTSPHTAHPSLMICHQPPICSLNTIVSGGLSIAIPYAWNNWMHLILINSFLSFQLKYYIFKKGFLWPPSPKSKVTF